MGYQLPQPLDNFIGCDVYLNDLSDINNLLKCLSNILCRQKYPGIYFKSVDYQIYF